jgi:bacillithiol system protein YtxJ
MTWHPLTTEEALAEFIHRSESQPVLFFKHSDRCPVSAMALRMFERDYNYTEDEIVPVFLDLIRYRNLSNQIAETFAVRHESPQIILVKNKTAIYNASHSMIFAESLKKFVE